MVGYVLLVIVGIIVIVGLIFWPKLAREHKEAKNLPIAAIDFNNLKDGTYIGEYEGGMYKWRVNKVQVTVSSGKVTEIIPLDLKDPNLKKVYTDPLYNSVMDAQSLQVDVISGATLTSKAYLKSVEDALLKAPTK